jgi:hypothetical protein
VIDGVVSEGVIKLLVSALPETERVVVCGTGIDTEARTLLKELAPGSALRKIPAALLDRYRSGIHPDYVNTTTEINDGADA